MKIEKNRVASIYYTVSESESQKVLQLIPEDQPQEFLFGNNLLIEIFESELLGLSEGDTFSFEAKADQAYGPVDPSAIFDLPLSTFAEEDGRVDEQVVQVGHVFPMEDKDGNRHFGKIIRKMKDRVTMDFNHPMAGKNLTFEGKVVAVRAARPEDIPPPES